MSLINYLSKFQESVIHYLILKIIINHLLKNTAVFQIKIKFVKLVSKIFHKFTNVSLDSIDIKQERKYYYMYIKKTRKQAIPFCIIEQSPKYL